MRLDLRAPAVLAAWCAGCAMIPLRGETPTPAPLPADLAAYYDYPKRTPEAAVTLVREEPLVREFLVQFPLAVEGFEPTEPVVEVEWFESTAPGRSPAILFNPILGGDYPLERGICRFLARHGFHAALVHRKTLKIGPDQDVSHIERLLRQGVIRIRQVVDWMERHERVDPQRLGSFGISMGGIAGVLTAAVEPRLRVHVIGLAGGSIPEILMTSRDSLLTKPLARYMTQRQLDRPAMRQLLETHVRTDPMRLAPYVDRRHVLMFLARFDRTVGWANALRLHHALGRPRASFLPTGHYTAYLLLPYVKRESLRFFQLHLRRRSSVRTGYEAAGTVWNASGSVGHVVK
jgi:hypothetical protein